MIYAATVTVAGGAVVEVFTALGISPIRCTVSLHSGDTGGITGENVLSQDSTGTSLSFAIPNAEGTPVGTNSYSFITDRDPVYVKNTYSGALNLYILLTAV